MSTKTESTTPPPKIGKIGPYTVFITPPSTPTEIPNPVQSPGSTPTRPPPVQAPPMQFPDHHSSSSASPFGFFWDAVAKIQSAHASLDQRTAYWFGLDESKYQWALDHYYETNGINDKDPETKVANKV